MTVENKDCPIFPLEDKYNAKLRTFSIFSYFIVLVIFGIPIWWYTTRVYRANLPLDEMLDVELESKLGKQLGVPLSLKYDVLITIVNPDPESLKVNINGRDIQYGLMPFLMQIAPIANFYVKSQWLFLVDIGVNPKKVDKEFQLQEEQLPHIITPLEKNLWSHLSPRPCLNLVIYVPYCKSTPLYIYNKENQKSESNAFLSPGWGGVFILNPSPEDCSKGEFTPDLNSIVSVFTAQLKKMFRIDNHYNLDELRKLQKKKAKDMLESSKRTLKSLAQLLSEIKSIVISDDVAKRIEISVENVNNAEVFLNANEIEPALDLAKQAFNYSESAFGDPSLLALLYFPDDQKYAV